MFPLCLHFIATFLQLSANVKVLPTEGWAVPLVEKPHITFWAMIYSPNRLIKLSIPQPIFLVHSLFKDSIHLMLVTYLHSCVFVEWLIIYRKQRHFEEEEILENNCLCRYFSQFMRRYSARMVEECMGDSYFLLTFSTKVDPFLSV